MTSEVRLSSKGQVILPKEVRDKLGLKKGDKLKIEIDERTKTILMQPSATPPSEIFIRVGSKLSGAILRESREQDEKKVQRILKAIGVN